MISDDWIIKLIDFGEAKVVDPYENGSVSGHNESIVSDGASSFFGRL